MLPAGFGSPLAGLLFVWADASSAEEAAAKEPFVPEELGESPNWSCFDVPASWSLGLKWVASCVFEHLLGCVEDGKMHGI